MAKYFLMMIALVSCNSIDVYDPYWYEDGLPHFEWIDQDEFNRNLIICRNADVCLAQNLFE